MSRLGSLAVFCGSSDGAQPEYRATARAFGALLAARGIGVVYGGAAIGLMGALADAALGAGGDVVGVLPRHLASREIAHPGLTRLELVDTMHERKARMTELADGFVALPGGLGTLEELFEIWTWGQLGLHGKPLGLLDVAGYYAPLVRLVDGMVEQGFVRAEHRAMLLVADEAEGLLERLLRYEPRAVRKWLDAEDVAPRAPR